MLEDGFAGWDNSDGPQVNTESWVVTGNGPHSHRIIEDYYFLSSSLRYRVTIDAVCSAALDLLVSSLLQLGDPK